MELGGRHGAISRRNMGTIERKNGHPASIFVLERVRQHAHEGVLEAREGEGGLVGQGPVERRPVYLKERGDYGHGLALGAEVPGMGHLLWCQLRLGAELHATLLGGLHAGAGAFGDQATLQLGQDADHLPHRTAGGGLGVDVLCQRAKLDALGTQLIQQGDEVTQTPA